MFISHRFGLLIASVLSVVLVTTSRAAAQVTPAPSEAAPTPSGAPVAESPPAPDASAAQPAPAEPAPAEPAPQGPTPAEPAPPPPSFAPTQAPPPAAPAEPTAPPSYEYAPVDEPPPPPAEPNPFGQGTLSISVLLGLGSGFGENYFILGAGAGYYLLDGFEVEFAAEAWLGGDPTIGKLTPGLRYVLHFVPVIKPYLGGFYRYTMIEDPYSNVSSLGVRFGAYLVAGSNLVVGLGPAYEHYLDSSWDPYWYPELTIALFF